MLLILCMRDDWYMLLRRTIQAAARLQHDNNTFLSSPAYDFCWLTTASYLPVLALHFAGQGRIIWHIFTGAAASRFHLKPSVSRLRAAALTFQSFLRYFYPFRHAALSRISLAPSLLHYSQEHDAFRHYYFHFFKAIMAWYYFRIDAARVHNAGIIYFRILQLLRGNFIIYFCQKLFFCWGFRFRRLQLCPALILSLSCVCCFNG